MTTADRLLHRFSQIVVLATFALIFAGGMVTTKGAGMAVPDWPLSFGSLNPAGWWDNDPVRLEHGHRLLASTVGLLVGILAAWVWRSRLALPVAVLASAVSVFMARAVGAEKIVVMHMAIWIPAAAFVITLLSGRRDSLSSRSPAALKLSIAAFIAVCMQATLGGLRVTEGSALENGYAGLPLLLAMVHGCVAQAFLCVVVALSLKLSPGRGLGVQSSVTNTPASVQRLGWFLVACVFLQLILGAMVRHSGAGLAITDFPLARGRIIPPMDSFPVAVHFAHRAGALVVTLAALAFIGAIIDARPIGVSPADCGVLAVLIIFQIALGAHIIWLVRPPVTTTLHVVTGAAVLAWSLRMALRVGRQRGLAAALEPRAAITGGAPA